MARILIIDDDRALRDSVAETVADLGHVPVAAEDGATGLARVAEGGIDAVLLDLRMPRMDGITVLRKLREARGAAPPVAVLTAVPTASNTIEAMRLGAVDHLAKPIGRADLAALIERMLPAPSSPPMTVPDGAGETLVGNSPAMRAVQKAIGMLADMDATVLITGETGTGKEVVARAIHRHGRRAAGPFIAVNCAAIPKDLLESELFGHVRGAFTGAIADRLGSFREADRGTLFLDEIGDMDPALQGKLLRVLQERVVTPVGGRPVPVDVRIIAATHHDLARAVREGRFREDLFWRIVLLPVPLPPLRERLSDILPLAEHFLALAGGGKRLSAEAASLLLSHTWPGNVRELRNAMERAAVLARHSVIAAADLGFLDPAAPVTSEAADSLDLPGAVARLEAALIRRALAASNGKRAEAARLLGIHRQLLHQKLQRYGLDPSGNRTESVARPDGDVGPNHAKTTS